MKIESIKELIDWSKNIHGALARCLREGMGEESDERARGLLEYLAGHEATLERIIARYEEQADPKALNTLVYDWEVHAPVDATKLCDLAFGTMSFDEITDKVFSIHNQVIELYRSLIARAPIPEEAELLQALLDAEEHETMQMAQQVNRSWDL